MVYNRLRVCRIRNGDSRRGGRRVVRVGITCRRKPFLHAPPPRLLDSIPYPKLATNDPEKVVPEKVVPETGTFAPLAAPRLTPSNPARRVAASRSKQASPGVGCGD